MQQGNSNPKEAHQLTLDDLRNIRSQLDKRSGAHCLAKWFQVTLNLHNGRSASCCLQPSKKIAVKPLSSDSSKIYNTPEHIDDRLKLRDGVKIEDCQACWSVEESGGFSERHYKSGDSWAWDKLAVADKTPDDVKPTYVEVSFSSQCQLRCSYCNPETSSSIAAEVEKFGAYPDAQTQMSRADRLRKGALPWNEEFPGESNPYIDSFWSWLPGVYEGLRVFRITGGEPFLSEDTFKFIEYVKNNPNPQMDIQFNSNLSFPEQVFERFMNVFKDVPKTHYKKVVLYASLDSWGNRAEYIRHGLRLSVMMDNIDKLLTEFPDLELRFTSTISILACHGLQEMLLEIANLKEKWGRHRVLISIYPLVFPSFQSIRIAKSDVERPLRSALEYARGNPNLFDEREVVMLEALCKLKQFDSIKSNQLITDFYLFFKEYDRRKKTKFLSTFPEFQGLWSKGQDLAQSQKTHLLGQIFSSDSKAAVKACSELHRIDRLDLDFQLTLARRLVEVDPLTLDMLIDIDTLHLKVTQYLLAHLKNPSCAHSILKLFFSRGYTLEKVTQSMKDIIIQCSDDEIYAAYPSWFDYLEQKQSNEIARRVFLNLFEYSLELHRFRLAERLLSYLGEIDGQKLPGRWASRYAAFFTDQPNTKDLLCLLSDVELDYLPGLALSKVSDQALLQSTLLTCLKTNIVTDVVVEAFKKYKTIFNNDLFAQLSSESSFSYARVALALERVDDLLLSFGNQAETLKPQQIASCLAQFTQAGINSSATFTLSLIEYSENKLNTLPWEWLDQAIALTGECALVRELDRVVQSHQSKSWHEELLDYIFKMHPDLNVVTSSSVSTLLKANYNKLDHKSWWLSLCDCDLDDVGWAIYRLAPTSIDLAQYPIAKESSALANRFSVLYQLKSKNKLQHWETIFKNLTDQDCWFVMDQIASDSCALALLACWTRGLTLDPDLEGKFFELLKGSSFPELVDSLPWKGLGLGTWATWVESKDFVIGLASLEFDDQAYAVTFQDIHKWGSQSFSELLKLNSLLIKECIYVHGPTRELSNFFKNCTSYNCFEVLRELDCHLKWRDELLCELISLYPIDIRREAMVWSFNNNLDLFSKFCDLIEIVDQDLWAILASCSSLNTDQLLQLLCLFPQCDSRELKANIITKGLDHQDSGSIAALSLPWFEDDLLLQLYCKHSRLESLLLGLRETEETIIYRALELWSSHQESIVLSHLESWHALGLNIIGKLYHITKTSAAWQPYLLSISPDRALEFIRAHDDLLLDDLLSELWPKLLDSNSSRIHEFGDWIKTSMKAEVVLALNCDHQVYGDYCLKLWWDTPQTSAPIVFTKLVMRFGISANFDYLSDQILLVYRLLTLDQTLISLDKINKDRIAATMHLFNAVLSDHALASKYLRSLWANPDLRIEALYSADREDLLKNHKILPWLMMRLSESLAQDDSIAWNIVDLIISNDLEKMTVLKLYQTLISKDERAKKPALKLISFAKELGSLSSF